MGLIGTELNRTDAEALCRKYGFRLVTIDSAAENEFLLPSYPAWRYWLGIRPDGADRFWTGSFSNWAPCQPNNSDNDGIPEDCAFSKPDGRWMDVKCNHRMDSLVCETP